jgi:DNA-binding transcriptional MerR regulator
MTGLSPATIRNWESRYAVVVGRRGAGGQRLYSDEQIDQLRFLCGEIEAGVRSADAHRALLATIDRHAVGTARAVTPAALPPASLGGVPLVDTGHAAAFVANAAEERVAIAPFVVDALYSGEQVVFLQSADRGREVTAWFGPIGDTALTSGQLRILDAAAVYLSDDRFEVERMLGRVATFAAESRAAGYRRVRFVGQMDWAAAAHPGVDGLVGYEARVSSVHAEQASAGLCVYNVDAMPARLVRDMMAVHPVVWLNGRAEVNPYFAPEEHAAP